MARSPKPRFKEIESLTHDEARRRNIPTAEMQSLYEREPAAAPVTLSYPRATPLAPGELRERNRDLDPQLVWRGKDEQDWSDLVVHAPPLYIQEKIHPKVIIEDLRRQSARRQEQTAEVPDLFADFNGLPDTEARLEFYQHDQNWSNRMILGDSLQVMASLAEREGLRGQVQCIYIDPPYGINFRSNWQVSTRSRDVKDGDKNHISREPEQIKAFRDTWQDGIHSYLTYLRDRLTVGRDLLHESGSIFVQIGDENVHRIRAAMDEVFGADNFCGFISVLKTTSQSGGKIPGVTDFVIWYAKNAEAAKIRSIYAERAPIENPTERYICIETGINCLVDLSVEQKSGKKPIPDGRYVKLADPTSQTGGISSRFLFHHWGRDFRPSGARGWSTNLSGMIRVQKADYFYPIGKNLMWKLYRDWFPYSPLNNVWADIRAFGFSEERLYVVQTATQIVQRCILMTSDPGDLVLDPTCGSATTAYVAEQWGRRWITIDTSRVAQALARTRIMGARYAFYLLADSEDGRRKEAEITGKVPTDGLAYEDIRQGFVCARAPKVTLKSIANNAEIDVIWEKWQETLEPLRAALNEALGES